MRIISGSFKGRKLCTPSAKERSIRPTSDRAREAIFNILTSRISGAVVLDLFAGTGAFGLEALSRGADTIVFIDESPLALTIIKENLHRCRNSNTVGREVHLLKRDLSKQISVEILPRSHRLEFDLIFADPPFGENLSLFSLDQIDKGSLLASDGLLIIEERNSIELPDILSRLKKVDRRRYGESGFHFYQYTELQHPADFGSSEC